MAPKANEPAKVHLVACFADALRNSISANRNGDWLCAASTMAGDTPRRVLDPGALVTSVRLRGIIHGDLRIEVSSRELPGLFPEATVDADVSRSWQALMDGAIRQLPKRAVDAGVFAFSVESHDLAVPGGDGVQIGRIELIEAGKTLVTIHACADVELLESLRIADATISGDRPRGTSRALMAPELGRVIDVPLSVTLRFGQRNMRLCDVLELNTGAVVELDRQVEDPVDLILDERVIARGEVVIVDGNYGLRVTEIVERHPTLVL